MLIQVRDVQGCFSESPIIKVVDINPKAIAWVEPMGTMFESGPFFLVRFIGNSAITVDADDYALIVEATK